MSKIVIALGGNALGLNPSEQKKAIQKFVPLIYTLNKSHKIVIVHGNGPQVGLINGAFEEYTSTKKELESMPFAECGAMSQGYIGYHIQNQLMNYFRKNSSNANVLTCLTQVEVAKDDPAFKNPTKPIGQFYHKEEAQDLVDKNGWVMKEDSGRGYRRVVPSPEPIDIIEKECINQLIESDTIVISCGGGGVPVVKNKDNELQGIDAVIDKDYAAALLAELIDADHFIILTAVDNVFINYGKDNQRALESISTEELESLIDENHFAEGSMLPKIKAALNFVKQSSNEAIITSIESAEDAINHKAGTVIHR